MRLLSQLDRVLVLGFQFQVRIEILYTLLEHFQSGKRLRTIEYTRRIIRIHFYRLVVILKCQRVQSQRSQMHSPERTYRLVMRIDPQHSGQRLHRIFDLTRLAQCDSFDVAVFVCVCVCE